MPGLCYNRYHSKVKDMKNPVSLLFSCALLIAIPQLSLAQMDELKNTTPEQRAQMQTIIQKAREKPQAAQ